MSKITCPYPGLRPFTESESVFFKGRDLHVKQIITQLEEKKIAIITGASGDGKSSLVYAGIIPNARAGFFKAEHNNWIIADFRPELSPLKNLAKTLSKNLNLDFDFVEEELSYGFSALIRIYQASEFYINKLSPEYQKLSDDEKKKLKQKASNLFILADQFEEFFTNSENFTNNNPSVNAYTTVNVLLETARIAKALDLPVYIAITMRSDYINQCVSFAGLPEYIGHSQFFIPRLNRQELQQIIEEPAFLMGGKVSKNVSEKLINDLPSTFDQLPILQHVLNQLWKYADDGKEEINMIHLAKAAGVPTRFLDKKNQEKFKLWFEKLDETSKKFFEKPALRNVLNTHANFLYETAFDYFDDNVKWAEKNITKEDSTLILKTAFQGLTKIDEGRAVRHRMTIEEITYIINKPHITYETVCGVLNIFRLPDNTFVRPFIDPNDVETEYLSAETVLDITHEALIRNWNYLKEWEQEEIENLANFKDLRIQVQRWIDNDKSKAYLLSIGQLAHFEEWFDKNKPNKYWIAKYEKGTFDKKEKLAIAENINNEISDFLYLSRKRIDEITARKKRNRRILFVAASIIILILSGITYFAMQEKQHAEEQTDFALKQTEIAKEQTEIANKEKIKAEEASQLAEKEKERAEDNAHQALLAQRASEIANREAQKQKRIAQEQTKIAKQEAERAGKEKKEAEKQRKIAEAQKIKANNASKNALRLSRIALSQSLALKAKNKYKSKQLNLLLANKAFDLNKENGGQKNDPIIYEALRFASANISKNSIAEIPANNYINSYLSGNKIILISENAETVEYNIKNKKVIKENSDYKTKIPVRKAIFLSDSKFILNLEDRTVKYIDLKKSQNINLQNYENYITTCEISNDNSIFIADRNNQIKIWEISENPKNEKTILLNSRANALKYSKNLNTLITGCNNGELISIDLNTMQQKIISRKKDRITTLDISQNNTLAVGYSNGVVEIYSLNKNYSFVTQKYISNAGIRELKYGKSSEMLTVSCNDRQINIYLNGDINKNPIVLLDQNQNTKAIIPYGDKKLFALCNDNNLHYWLSTEDYAKLVKSLIIRDFTDSEWRNYIGINN